MNWEVWNRRARKLKNHPRPIRLVMSRGQPYDVRHPGMAMLTKTDMLVGVGEEDDGVPAGFRICSLLRVTAVEPLPVGQAARN